MAKQKHDTGRKKRDAERTPPEPIGDTELMARRLVIAGLATREITEFTRANKGDNS